MGLGLAGCGSHGTYVRVIVEQRGGTVPSIRTIELDLMLNGRSEILVLGNGKDLVLPVSKTLEILSGSGTLTVTALVKGANGVLLEQGSADAPVVRGDSIDIPVMVGAGGGPDGGVDGGSPALSFGAPSVDFGSADLGSVNKRDLVLHNTGTGFGAIQLLTTGDNTEFTVMSECDAGLAPGATCLLHASFMPTTLGSKSATLTASSGAATASVTLFGATNPVAILSQQATAFPTTAVQSSSTATVTVHNDGNTTSAALTVNGFAAPFAITADTCSTQKLPPGSSCAVTLRFTPSVAGSFAAPVMVAGRPGEATSVVLSAMASASVQVQQTSLGTIVMADGSPDIACGSTCTATFTRSPIVLQANLSFWNQLVSWTGCDSNPTPDTCSLTLTTARVVAVNGLRRNIVSVTSAVRFGTLATGRSTSPFTVDFSNASGLPQSGLSAALGGPDAVQFMLSGTNTCSGTWPSGGTCSLGVAYSPGAAGSHQALLDVTDSTGTVLEIPLSGTAVPPASLTLSAATFSGGLASVTVTNSGAATGSLSLSITGQDKNDFMILADNCGQPVGTGASCTVNLKSTPQRAGSRLASLLVTATPGGSATTPLQDTGSFPVQISLGNSNHGTVTLTPSGFVCSTGNCQSFFTASLVSLRATATGGAFTGWVNACAYVVPGDPTLCLDIPGTGVVLSPFN